MSVPHVINDGNWNTLTPMSGDSIEFPFSDKGDNVTFKATIPYRQDKDAYRPRATMSVLRHALGTCYLTKLGTPRDIGNNIYEFEDEFSSVPIKRIEQGSLPYVRQWATENITESGSSLQIDEVPFTLSAEFEFEYFRDKQPEPLIRPRVINIVGRPYAIGGFGLQFSLVGAPGNNRVVAEDSEVKIYEGRIYERRTPYIRLQPLRDVVLT